MQMKLAIGTQSFERIRTKNLFYIDKTAMIKEWWTSEDDITLITRPRRFGKTLNMSMLDCFFSLQYTNRGDLFEGLSIWEEEEYRELQGTYPVINLSFAALKATNFEEVRFSICQLLTDIYDAFEDFFKKAELFIFEFKVFRPSKEKTLEDTVQAALQQIEDKKYVTSLLEKGIPKENIYCYGFAFEGKTVLIGK